MIYRQCLIAKVGTCWRQSNWWPLWRKVMSDKYKCKYIKCSAQEAFLSAEVKGKATARIIFRMPNFLLFLQCINGNKWNAWNLKKKLDMMMMVSITINYGAQVQYLPNDNVIKSGWSCQKWCNPFLNHIKINITAQLLSRTWSKEVVSIYKNCF